MKKKLQYNAPEMESVKLAVEQRILDSSITSGVRSSYEHVAEEDWN